MPDHKAELAAIHDVVAAMLPILAGHSPAVQGAALAECLAMWLAGHTQTMRTEMLTGHLVLVRDLVAFYAKKLANME